MRYLLFLFVFISSTTLAQNGINYQGAATDSDGAKLVDQNISLRTSVLQGGVEGTISYSETHSTTTDQFGLFNVVIGQGEVVSGVLGNFVATVETIESERRIWVLMDIMGQITRVRVAPNQVKLKN